MGLFFDDIIHYGSVSVVGLAKNVGKTVCLRSILDHYAEEGHLFAITSIGVDGEKSDVVLKTEKPELTFYPGMITQTSEIHYRQKKLTAEILEVSQEKTALGRLITSRVQQQGKLILSGYSYTQGLQKFIQKAHEWGAKTALIDGALSRMSLASPAVADAMILCTGLALTKNISSLIQQTEFQCRLIDLPVFSGNRKELEGEKNMAFILEGGELVKLPVVSTLHLKTIQEYLEKYDNVKTIYLPGMLSDAFLQFVRNLSPVPEILINDFTKVFVRPFSFQSFSRSGGRISVLQQTRLLAVCLNPSSPDGYRTNSSELCSRLSETLSLPVWDMMQIQD